MTERTHRFGSASRDGRSEGPRIEVRGVAFRVRPVSALCPPARAAKLLIVQMYPLSLWSGS
jgi:hypothetical protein